MVIFLTDDQMLLEVCFEDVDEFLGSLCLSRCRIPVGVYHMKTDVAFDDFGHEAVNGPATGRNGEENLRAVFLLVDGLFHGLAHGDAGDTWAPIVRDLPAVLSVEVQTLQ